MAQNIYDDPAFFEGYSQLQRSQKGLAGAPEWAALRACLPDMTGLNVVDLGCGYGWFSRWASENQAQHVLALDVSARMLARAAQTGTDTRITYEQADLEHLTLSPAQFDLAYSALALHYIKDLPRLFATVFDALKPGANFVFSIEHPIFMAPRQPGWQSVNGRKIWPLSDYQREGQRTTDWLAPGVIKYHRTQGTLLTQLIHAGFALTHVQDWGPTPDQLADIPALDEEMDRPMMLIVAARKPTLCPDPVAPRKP